MVLRCTMILKRLANNEDNCINRYFGYFVQRCVRICCGGAVFT